MLVDAIKQHLEEKILNPIRRKLTLRPKRPIVFFKGVLIEFVCSSYHRMKSNWVWVIDEGLRALKHFVDQRTLKEPTSEKLLRLAKLVLTLNCFSFGGN